MARYVHGGLLSVFLPRRARSRGFRQRFGPELRVQANPPKSRRRRPRVVPRCGLARRVPYALIVRVLNWNRAFCYSRSRRGKEMRRQYGVRWWYAEFGRDAFADRYERGVGVGDELIRNQRGLRTVTSCSPRSWLRSCHRGGTDRLVIPRWQTAFPTGCPQPPPQRDAWAIRSRANSIGLPAGPVGAWD